MPTAACVSASHSLVLCALPLLPDFPFGLLVSNATTLSAPPLVLLAVFTNAMIYIDTRRTLWSFPQTAMRFFGTTASFLALGQAIENPAFRPLAAKSLPELRLLLLAADLLERQLFFQAVKAPKMPGNFGLPGAR